jgi:hypothetical protein
MTYDRVIIGAGLYGLYSAWICGRSGLKTLVIEQESAAFSRATYINQARVHMGYHYPRSLTTAKKSADYFERFCDDFEFCILKKFNQIYATSSYFSWTSAQQFEKFCRDAGIKCDRLSVDSYFKAGMCDGAFLTEEYTYDAMLLRDFLIREISMLPTVSISYNTRVEKIYEIGDHYSLVMSNGESAETSFVLNVTYASVNQILSKLGYDLFKIKYELCEIILCDVNDKLREIGFTVMDGPFFSIMPFGKTGLHSLTSVSFTPHVTSYSGLPTFNCQSGVEHSVCSPSNLGNCNLCTRKPNSAWEYMSALARKYLNDSYLFKYRQSLYSMKPILKSSEVDDSRPTVIKISNSNPTFISVLSGKINTVYDLDDILILRR